MDWQSVWDFVFTPQCGGCGAAGSGLCTRCLPPESRIEKQFSTLHVRALGAYDGALRRAVLALKRGRRDVARAFAERLEPLVCAGVAIVPVPTTAARRRERGFDGCSLIARLTCLRSANPLDEGLVQVAGDAQRGRTRSARLAALGRFAWRAAPLEGRIVVLLDDVVTTGATLEDCASAVRAAGGTIERAIAVAIAI